MRKVVASIMCADQLHLQRELHDIKEAGIDWLHCDVMDGVFVNNLAMGPYVLEQIIQTRSFVVDIHLACIHPERYVEMFAPLKPDYITFHLETCDEVSSLLSHIHAHGMKAGIAISPDTPIEAVYPYLEEADLLLVMCVNPGFAGQKFQKHVLKKLEKLSEYALSCKNMPLVEVDGNINEETASQIARIGADLYVVGTSALFNKSDLGYPEKVERMERVIQP